MDFVKPQRAKALHPALPLGPRLVDQLFAAGSQRKQAGCSLAETP